jgi:hypothetical protein
MVTMNPLVIAHRFDTELVPVTGHPRACSWILASNEDLSIITSCESELVNWLIQRGGKILMEYTTLFSFFPMRSKPQTHLPPSARILTMLWEASKVILVW